MISFNSVRHYHEIKIGCTISAKSLVSRPSGTLRLLYRWPLTNEILQGVVPMLSIFVRAGIFRGGLTQAKMEVL